MLNFGSCLFCVSFWHSLYVQCGMLYKMKRSIFTVLLVKISVVTQLLFMMLSETFLCVACKDCLHLPQIATAKDIEMIEQVIKIIYWEAREIARFEGMFFFVSMVEIRREGAEEGGHG